MPCRRRVERVILRLDSEVDLTAKGTTTAELEEELSELKRLRAEKEPYFLLASQLIDPFLHALGVTP
jgi:hypothetical protein